MHKTYPHKRVLVTDGYWRKSLAVIRALSQEGLKVDVGERTILSTALFSNSAHKRYIYPSVKKYPTDFLNWLKKTVAATKYDALIVPEEDTALLVAKHKEDLSQFVNITLPDYEAIQFLRDKSRLIAHALSVGIACAKTKVISKLDELPEFSSHLTYPVVLKPNTGTGSRGVRYIKHDASLEILIKKSLLRHAKLLVQEFIPGNKYFGVSVIFNKNNTMRSAFVHQKLRQYPITGGVSTYAISVKHQHLIEITEHLLKSIGWYGVANAEFKIDERTNRPILMEVNPRFWGSLQLAISSGIDFPYLLYKLAVDGDIKPKFDYSVGVKFRWILQGDLMYFLSSLFKHAKIDPHFFQMFEKNMCHAIGSYSDPLPIIGKLLSSIDFIMNAEMRRFHD
jgi:predicted ATP-grasp superfamily ATP-dependent carboligase